MPELSAISQHNSTSTSPRERDRGAPADTSSAIAFSFQQLLQSATPLPHRLSSSIDMFGSRSARGDVEPRMTGDDRGRDVEPSPDRLDDPRGSSRSDDRAARAGEPDTAKAAGEDVRPAGEVSFETVDAPPADEVAVAGADEPWAGAAAADVRSRSSSSADAATMSNVLPRADAPLAAKAAVVRPGGGIQPTPADLAAAGAGSNPAPSAIGGAQMGATVTREADVLISAPVSTLAPAATVAAEAMPAQRPLSTGDGVHAVTTATTAGVVVGAAATATAAGGPSAGGSRSAAASGTAAAVAAAKSGGTSNAGSIQAPGAEQQQAQGQAQAQAQGSLAANALAALTPGDIASGSARATASSAASAEIGAARSSTAASGSAGFATNPGFGSGGPLGQTPSSAAKTPTSPARPGGFQQQVVTDQVNVHIKKAVQEGADRIDIKLKPEALGRVEVRLELSQDGRVAATVTADQRHTLELLRADARSLERALQEAGLQADSGSLSFNLRGEGGGAGQQGPDGRRTAGRPLPAAEEIPDPIASTPNARYGGGRQDGIDIRA